MAEPHVQVGVWGSISADTMGAQPAHAARGTSHQASAGGAWPEPHGRYPPPAPAVAPKEMVRSITVCVVALALLIGCNQTPSPTLVTVPNLIGTSVPQAEAELKGTGLRSDATMEGPCPACPGIFSPPVPAVSEEKPSPGTNVAQGTVVVLGYPCEC